MERMIAVCGLDCGQCEARLATQAGDEPEKERIAANWRVQFNAPNITAAYVTCDGCLELDGHLGGHCYECDIRACGLEHALSNCAHCANYGSCEKLVAFLNFVPQARASLEEIRRSL
jgi:hypothetical protein